MQCPSCGAGVDESSSAFCPRCGATLGSPEDEATQRMGSRTEEIDGATERTGDPAPAGAPQPRQRSQDPFGPRRAVYDFVYAARRSLVAGGWFEAASAAGIGFLALLCVGVVFLAAGRLQYPDIGAGTNPLSVLTSVVVLALGSLRIPIHLGDLSVTALPLGALVLSALAVSWAVEPAIRRRGVHGLRAHIAAGAKIALPFALLCLAASLVFRFRGGTTPTYAAPVPALFLGAVWGTLFGALGGLRTHGSLWAGARSVARAMGRRGGILYEGLRTGGLMLAFSFVLAAAAGLLWVIVELARGAPVRNFGGGDALAGLLYAIAFLPNLLVAILAIAFGAQLDVGAQITIDGRQVGPLRTISLWDWGPEGTPWLAFALLLIPVVAMVAAGYFTRARSTRGASSFVVFAIGALVFALVLSLLAWLGEARLGAGLVRARGFAVIAANPALVFATALAWGLIGGVGGWKLAERRRGRPAAAQHQSHPPKGEAA